MSVHFLLDEDEEVGEGGAAHESVDSLDQIQLLLLRQIAQHEHQGLVLVSHVVTHVAAYKTTRRPVIGGLDERRDVTVTQNIFARL